MTVTFKTKLEALTAGYRTPVRGQDRDISGYNSFGYAFEDEGGNRTVDVNLTEERNSIGQFGAYTPMFPPTSEVEVTARFAAILEANLDDEDDEALLEAVA